MRDSKQSAGLSSAAATFDFFGLGYTEIDEHGLLAIANSAALSLFDRTFTPSPAEFFPEWPDGLFQDAYQRALSGESGRLQDYCQSLDGYYEARFSPRPGGGAILLFEDLGPLRLRESQARSNFLAKLSHDVRTPVGAILGYVDLLSREITNGEHLECLKVIRRNGLTLLELINESLDLSRIEAENAPISVNALLEVEDHPLLRGSKVLLVDDDGDLRDLFGSYLREAGATVITTEDGPSTLDYLQANHVDVVLLDMQMQRLDGYATARELRRRTQLVPILAVTETGDSQACLEAGCSAYLPKPVDCASLLNRVAEVLVRGKGLRLLVVEDNHLAATATRAVLNSLGCETVLAYDAQQALAEVHRHGHFDLILIDLGLPDMDGGALLARLKEVPDLGNTRFIAHTGDDPGEVAEIFGQLFDDVLQKPVDCERLLKLLLF